MEVSRPRSGAGSSGLAQGARGSLGFNSPRDFLRGVLPLSETRPLRRHQQLRLMVDPVRRAAAVSVIELRDIDPDSDTDADAFDALYVRYAPYVAAIGARLLGQCDEVDDLVQDVFVQVLRGLGQLREPAAFKGWLAQITIRGATHRLRKRKLRWAFMGARVPEQHEFLSPHTTTPEQRTLGTQLYKLLDALPAKSRVIWILRHIEGEPLHVIARRASCSLSTVQRRLVDAQTIIESMFVRDFAT